MMTIVRALLAAAVWCACAASAIASQLYAVNNNLTSSTLYTVDAFAVPSPVGVTGLTTIVDLASNPANGTLWAVDYNIDFATWDGRLDNLTSNLHTLNPATGIASAPIAFITGPASSRLAIGSLAYDIASGKLYGNTITGVGGATRDQLYEINPYTGAATLIGNIFFSNVIALGADNFGVLYGISEAGKFITIDKTTGAGSLVASLAPGTYHDIAARPEDNTLYILKGAAELAGEFLPSRLLQISPQGVLLTDAAVSTETDITGLAFIAEVPEPSTYVLMLAGLLGLAWVARRRVR
jgi:hypothetical protein